MIKTYFGPMGSGKTKTLVELYNNIYFKDKVQVFAPKMDDRFGVGVIQDRNDTDGSRKIYATPIDDIFQIEGFLQPTTKKVFIDEINFLESEENPEKGIDLRILEKRRYESMRLILKLAQERKIAFYLFGLNLTAEMKPYGLMPIAMAYADDRIELFAECADCGEVARFSYYIPYEKGTNAVGAEDYCALCAKCHFEWESRFKQYKAANQIEEYLNLAKALKPNKQ